MKKMLIVLPKMSMGGMERSAANLLNLSNYTKNYKVTLLVGYIADKSLFDKLPKNINLEILYKGKWNLVGKIITAIRYLIKYISFLVKRNKYDVSICYSHHHAVLAKLTRRASKNNICFVHNDLKKSRTEKQVSKMKFDKFGKIVCVSNAAKEVFTEIFPKYDKNNIYIINNYIDGNRILDLANENINDMSIEKERVTFINIARHLDPHKKISRILEATKRLKIENYKFKVVLVGSGPDTQSYIDYVNSNNLKEYVDILGNKANPYPYLKISSAFLFSSAFEGYGMVLDESRVLNIPIITTDVADAKIITEQGYGILCDNSSEGVYIGMKKFLEEGYNISQKFDYNKFNDNITERLDEVASFI